METLGFTNELHRRLVALQAEVEELRRQNQQLQQENLGIKVESLETAHNATTTLIDGLNIARMALIAGFTAPGLPSLQWVETLLQKQRANHERLFAMAQSLAARNGYLLRIECQPGNRDFVKFSLLTKSPKANDQ